mmetsp:Transcript_80922/g.133692  ORF Transcript_80922/g.133692 Transcript_80922/m.133692 type:complete len:196 (+) Transcript_80922:80-667(+)
MLLPMPAMPAPMGPPSEYALSMVPYVLAALIFQGVVCFLRMFLLLDIMGGFIMAVAIGIGVYAWKQDMHITFICYWGMMSLLNGVFDLVKVIDYQVKSPFPMFSAEAPPLYNIASLAQLLIPVSELVGGIVAYYLYKDATDPSWNSTTTAAQSALVGGGNGLGTSDPTSSLRQSSRSEPTFKTFSGQGNRLGDDV